MGTTDLNGGALFNAEFGIRHRGSTVPERSGVCTQFLPPPGVKIPFIKALDIPLPSISEQKRTVAILDQAFADIDKARALTEQNLKNACELFESYLQQVFSQRGEGWVECSLGDVAEFKNGLNFSKNSKGEHVKIAGVKDFQSNYVISANEFETAQVDGELSESYELVEGDILTVRSNGNKRLIGRCALVEKISHKTSFSGFIIRIRLMSQNIDPKFLNVLLKVFWSARDVDWLWWRSKY
ncbi:hypothetical protein ULG90_20915 [Halopseudomonas pachastrellae]|nr:hypothetical protein ULG90_20915 [Halopseudomonas pachastrellae]